MMRLLLTAVVVAGGGLTGCERSPLELDCPAVGPGGLVISEIRGKQSTNGDTWGQWLEIFNPGPEAIDVAGLALVFAGLAEDENERQTLFVHEPGLIIDPGGFLVLGRLPYDDLPAHVDYGFENEFSGDFYPAGVLELRACDQGIDSVIYDALPKLGTLAFDGALTLSAEANDNQDNWCTDDFEPGPDDGPVTQVGIPGTPGKANRACEVSP